MCGGEHRFGTVAGVAIRPATGLGNKHGIGPPQEPGGKLRTSYEGYAVEFPPRDRENSALSPWEGP